ncbi:hypothetical protein AAHZ94_27030, partial [Streptomyces sp. HSW2009]|uniref:hypothetical protein n=1 Tax=Streptomyces sp. HSW2009 TaxID=3142890 RepID=UPI0032EB145C
PPPPLFFPPHPATPDRSPPPPPPPPPPRPGGLAGWRAGGLAGWRAGEGARFLPIGAAGIGCGGAAHRSPPAPDADCRAPVGVGWRAAYGHLLAYRKQAVRRGVGPGPPCWPYRA